MKKFSSAIRVPAVFLLTLLFALACGLSAAGAAPKTDGNKPVKLTKLIVTPSKLQLYPEQTENFTVRAVYSDKTVKDVTADAGWVSSKPAIATVEGGKVTAIKKGSSRITAVYGGKKATKTVTVKTDKLMSLTPDPKALSVCQGDTGQVKLTAKFKSGMEADVTGNADWSISSPDIATVAGGRVTGVKPGTAVLTAVYERKTFKIVVSVTEPQDAAIVAAVKAELALNDSYSEDFTLTTESKGCAISWVSCTPAVIAIDGAAAKVTRPADLDASVTLTATIKKGEVSDTRAFTVTVPKRAAPAKGAAVTLTATGTLGYTAAVVLTGYDTATHFQLLDANGSALTTKEAVGATPVVLFLNKGDQCKVQIYNGDNLLDIQTVTAG